MTGPAPGTTAWQEYLAATRELQEVRGDRALASEAATRATSTARAELAQVPARLAETGTAPAGGPAGRRRGRGWAAAMLFVMVVVVIATMAGIGLGRGPL